MKELLEKVTSDKGSLEQLNNGLIQEIKNIKQKYYDVLLSILKSQC